MGREEEERIIFVGRDGKEIVSGFQSARKPTARAEKKGPKSEAPPVSVGRNEIGSAPGGDFEIVFIDKSGKEIVGLMGVSKPAPDERQRPSPPRRKRPAEDALAQLPTVGEELIFITASGRELVGGRRSSTQAYEPPVPTAWERRLTAFRGTRLGTASERAVGVLLTAPVVYIVVLGAAGTAYHLIHARELEYLDAVKQELLADIASRDVHAEAARFALERLDPIHVSLRTAELPHEEIMRRHEEGDQAYRQYAEAYFARFEYLKLHYRQLYEEYSRMNPADFRQNF